MLTAELPIYSENVNEKLHSYKVKKEKIVLLICETNL